jgi:Tfp pilus assembly protein PilF
MKKTLLPLLALIAAPFVMPRTSRACGMYEPPVAGTLVERIDTASQYVKDGAYGSASRYASSVIADAKAKPTQKAEAWDILAVIALHNGNKAQAKTDYENAKKLDSKALATVIAKTGEKDSVKKELEA